MFPFCWSFEGYTQAFWLVSIIVMGKSLVRAFLVSRTRYLGQVWAIGLRKLIVIYLRHYPLAEGPTDYF